MEQNEVVIAFDIVLEEIEDTIEALNKEGAKAFQAGNYEAAKELIERGSQMIAFRAKVKELQKEWLHFFAAIGSPKSSKRKRNITSRLKRGLRTPEDEFRIPILQSLVELGGHAPMAVVLDRVEEKMNNQLNEYDRSPLPSDASQIRWRNTAQWARNAMVKEGLMSSHSPRGIWEITDEGRKWLVGELGKNNQ